MTFLEDIVLLEKIGSGSYSTVYRAKRKFDLKEFVAVKIVEKAKLSTRGKNDIVTEVKMMKMLKHKFVVEMYQFEYDQKNIYIIMEYCDGGDLSTFIKKRNRLSEKICKKFLQQLAVGLKFLRSHNISHLDLKPQNLLLVTKPKMTLKIGDFGFAQFLNDAVQDSCIKGSPLYMAPEMLLNKKYDIKADLWSVGVITYECLFGEAPYPSKTYNELYFKIKAKTPVKIPSDVNLSEECRDFINNLLIHDPEKRMNYEKFFNHPFLDLKYFPSQSNYEKAMEIVKDAIRLEETGKFVEAFNRYCETLRYLFPIVNDEINEEKKCMLRVKIAQYTQRAEELRSKLTLNIDCPDSVTESQSSSQNCTDMSVNKLREMNKIIEPRSRPDERTILKELSSLCFNTPNLKTALEIGINAQLYLAEGKYNLALEKYRSSLGLLIPALHLEPNGRRKELMYLQVQEWMKQAESTKSLLSCKQNDETSQMSSEMKDGTCSVQ